MRQDTQIALPLPGGVRLTPQRRAQQALVPRERALRLPALPVDRLGEALLHLPAVARLGPLPPLIAAGGGGEGAAGGPGPTGPPGGVPGGRTPLAPAPGPRSRPAH